MGLSQIESHLIVFVERYTVNQEPAPELTGHLGKMLSHDSTSIGT